MSRICPLFSSSKGNATYLSGGGTSLLIDAGVSLKQLRLALADHTLAPEHLSGVIITHEHTDHIRGLPMLLKHYDLPLYATAETLEYLFVRGYVPGHTRTHPLTGKIDIDGIQVTAFDTPHDACHSVGFRMDMPDGRVVGYATDLGHISDTVWRHIEGCDLVMLESNYDPGMLECSAYPWPLKRRIRSNTGHLSNDDCADTCIRLIQSGTTHLILGHLSENNNLPTLARQTAKSTLDCAKMRENLDYILGIAPARGQSVVTVF